MTPSVNPTILGVTMFFCCCCKFLECSQIMPKLELGQPLNVLHGSDKHGEKRVSEYCIHQFEVPISGLLLQASKPDTIYKEKKLIAEIYAIKIFKSNSEILYNYSLILCRYEARSVQPTSEYKMNSNCRRSCSDTFSQLVCKETPNNFLQFYVSYLMGKGDGF